MLFENLTSPTFMLFACIIINILAIALPSLRISPLLRIAAISLFRFPRVVPTSGNSKKLLYTAVILPIIVYIQSIGSGIEGYSGLFNDFLLEILTGQLLVSSLVPVKPGNFLIKVPNFVRIVNL